VLVELGNDAVVEVVEGDMVVGRMVEGYAVDNLAGIMVDNMVGVPEASVAFVVDDLVADLYWWWV
jgi:hypothetical protein